MSKEERLHKLAELFYDPATGFISTTKLIAKAREHKIYLSPDDIRKWYKEQAVNQIFSNKHMNNRNNYYHIYAPAVGQLVADLVDMSTLARSNEGYHWLLNIIDTHSRYVWSFPLKTKQAVEVEPYIKQVFKEVHDKYPNNRLTFTTDDGGEFKGPVNVMLDKFLPNLIIKHYVANPNDNTKRRTATIESFNRTILNRIKKAMYATNTVKYVDILPKIISNYNNTIHTVIKRKPIDVFTGAKKSKESDAEGQNDFHDPFKIGDYVRIALYSEYKPAHSFSKRGREPLFTKQVYRIVGRDGVRYMVTKIGSLKLEAARYLPRQLMKVEKPLEVKQEMKSFEDLMKELKQQKRFVKKQRESGLDVSKEGEIVLPKASIPLRPKREVKLPSRYHD